MENSGNKVNCSDELFEKARIDIDTVLRELKSQLSGLQRRLLRKH